MSQHRILRPDPFPYLDYSRYTYSIGVAAGGLIWAAGQEATEYDADTGRLVRRGGLREQALVAYDKTRLILESGDAGMEDAVHVVEYITPAAVREFHEVQEVRRRLFGDRPPLVTSVVVNRLLRPDSLIEVEALAVRSGSSRRSFETAAIGMGSRAVAAVECNGLLIVSTGTRLGGSDTTRQAEALYECIGELLAAAGATPSDVVRTIDYITPDALSSYRGAAGARQALFGDSSPAGTAVVVERLLDPDTLLHVTAIAVVGDGPRRIYSPGWPRDGRLLGSPGAGKGKLVCLEGMTGADPETGAVAEGDVAAQTQVAYEKAAAVLSAAGLSMGHVVKTVDYIAPTALESYRATADVRRGFFESGYPVATGVVVNRLLRPEWLIEVDFTAVTD